MAGESEMSDVVVRKTIRGNQWNYHREASVEVYEGGIVRIQQPGSPVDVVLLTPHQLRQIVKMAATP